MMQPGVAELRKEARRRIYFGFGGLFLMLLLIGGRVPNEFIYFQF